MVGRLLHALAVSYDGVRNGAFRALDRSNLAVVLETN